MRSSRAFIRVYKRALPTIKKNLNDKKRNKYKIFNLTVKIKIFPCLKFTLPSLFLLHQCVLASFFLIYILIICLNFKQIIYIYI
jgi:hypothetical protein